MEITVTKDNFESEVIKSDVPVLLDFWATWCGPCRMIAPYVEKIAEKYEGKLKVGKINVDEEQALAISFGIDSIPTLFVMKDGKAVKKTMGYMPLEKLEQFVSEFVK